MYTTKNGIRRPRDPPIKLSSDVSIFAVDIFIFIGYGFSNTVRFVRASRTFFVYLNSDVRQPDRRSK